MANEGNDQLLMRVAVVGITFSIICTMGLALMLDYGGDYDYDTISAYRNDLSQFTGKSMINETPWVLSHVYTPFTVTDSLDINHVDEDGWLYGQEITDYEYIGDVANIKLNNAKKSSIPISVNPEKPSITFEDGFKWWADNPIDFITRPVGEFFGNDPYNYSSIDAASWDFTGWRYVFDPCLPFRDENTASSKDGALSLVWYSFNGNEGLSGGLQVYNGDVILASYSATDIVADYNNSSAYATTYDFNFEGVLLHLSIRFDPDVLNEFSSGSDWYAPLMAAWSAGRWTMAISSVSAGNFLDVQDSNSFAATAGGMVDTFIKIYTWQMPEIQNPWAMTVIWLLVGLPMTIAMLCVTMRMVSAVRLF